jgi:hypothetical protein
MQTPAFAATKTVRTSRLFRGLIWVAAAMAASLCPTRAFGQTIDSYWGTGTGNWNDAAYWSPNQVPNNSGKKTYDVTIISGFSTNTTLTLNENVTISYLTIGPAYDTSFAELSEAAGAPETLTVTNVVDVLQKGTIDLESGSTLNVNGSGYVINYGYVVTNLAGFNGGTNTLNVPGAFYNEAGGYLDLGNGNKSDVANIGTLVNSGRLDINSGATLNLTNQPNGITDISAGSNINLYGTGAIRVDSSNGLANLASVEGTFNLINGEALTITDASLTVSTTGFVDLVNSSTLVANGNVTNSGIVQTGIYNESVQAGNTLTVGGTFTNNAGAQFNVGLNDVASVGTLANNGTLTIGPNAILNLANSGGSFVQTSGQTVVNGTLNSVPTVQIKGGTLSGSGTINGNVIMGGRLSPGNSPGILTINGNYTQTAFGAYIAELEGLKAGTGYDQVDVNGTADLAGKLDVDFLNGFTVALGDSFILMKYDSETGTYSMVDLPELNTGLKWDLSYDPGYLDLSVTSGVTTTPEPSTYLLWGTAGLLGIGIWVRRKFGRGLKSSV